jgi:hypothetical protein
MNNENGNIYLVIFLVFFCLLLFVTYQEYRYNQDEITVNRDEELYGYKYVKAIRRKGLLHIVLEYDDQLLVIRNHSKLTIDDRRYRVRLGLNTTYILFKELN